MNDAELLAKGFQLGVETTWKWIEAHGRVATKQDLNQMEDRIMAKVSELAGLLTGISNQLEKASQEILAKIATLEQQLGDVDIPADAQATLDAIKAKAQGLDDIVPG